MGKHDSKRKLEKGHHVVPNDTEGGKCFTRHVSALEENSCSHRWQAWKRAYEDRAAIYNAYRSSDVRKVFKTKNPPVHPAWNVPSPFPKSSREPYGHNAHHIIPNGVLLKCLNKAANATPNAGRARMLMKGGLQLAEYNLNHKINMIILPTRHRTGWVLKLPVHTEKDHFHHEAYSAAVEVDVDEVMRDYVKAIKNEIKDHEALPKKLAKKKLEDTSDSFREAIVDWGKTRHDLYLDRIPPTHYDNY
jgi:hypothetical protein